MKINILKNNLVPEHTIVPAEEVEAALAELNATVDQLPKMLPNDPVSKAIDAKLGDVVRIKRESATAGEFISYRVVRE